MIWKSRRGAEADPPWSLVARRIVPGLVVGAVLLSGGGRRAVTGLYRRYLRDRIADIGLGSLRASAPAMTGPSDPPAAQVALTVTNEDAASDPGPPLTGGPGVPPSGASPSAGSLAILVDPQGIPEEQPLGSNSPAAESGSIPADSVAADGSPTCPAEFPIKGNGRSGIYHLPGAFAYDRTVPSICFRSIEAAERAGFRSIRSRNP